MTAKACRYDDEDVYYAAIVDDIDNAPAAQKELRQATIELILVHGRRPGQRVVKVTAGDRPVRSSVRGYATFLECVEHSDLRELEERLGFKTGALQHSGALLYFVDAFSLHAGNIAPRGNSDWSGGVTPRDLYELSARTGTEVGYHRDYPSASRPIIQFEIQTEVPVLGAPRFLGPHERV
jgi:hypothetical protein